MIIAQISDLHINAAADTSTSDNCHRLNRVLDCLTAEINPPDLLLVSGDITEYGGQQSYALYAETIKHCSFPIWPAIGNHDQRDNFRKFFPHHSNEQGFIQYVIDLGDLRLLVVDTVEEGLHGGAFCSARAEWLDRQLAAAPDTPSYIVMHHPPMATGIAWMDTQPQERWVHRFTEAIAPYRQLRGIFCGHLHRAVTLNWDGRVVVICSSVAPQVALDMRAIDPAQPDGRAMIVKEEPAYMIHRWDGRDLVSFFCTARDYEPLVRYDESMQNFLRNKAAERNRTG